MAFKYVVTHKSVGVDVFVCDSGLLLEASKEVNFPGWM